MSVLTRQLIGALLIGLTRHHTLGVQPAPGSDRVVVGPYFCIIIIIIICRWEDTLTGIPVPGPRSGQLHISLFGR